MGSFPELMGQWMQQGLRSSLGPFGPELTIVATIVLILLNRILDGDRYCSSRLLALLGSGLALWLSCQLPPQVADANTMGVQSSYPAKELFTGLLKLDAWTVFFRVYLLLFLVLTIALTWLSRLVDDEDGPDFYAMLLGSTLGMLLMASSNHALMLFLAIEMTSIPSYALAGFLKGRRSASEAALKFAVYGAAAAGVLLYGLSLLCGVLGTAEFSQMGLHLTLLFEDQRLNWQDPTSRVLLLSLVLIFAGFAFKLSVVPFHFWCPDVFEGAAAELAGYLSVASKAAAFALMMRFFAAIFRVDLPIVHDLSLLAGIGLGAVAIVTATLGNLAAYPQTNLKRMFAYSTIAQAGYLMMAVAAWVILTGSSQSDEHVATASERALEGLLYYLVAYLFMNMGVFAVIAFIRNRLFSENLPDWQGVGRQVPFMTGCLAVCLFSLVGLPPFGGFVGKLFVFFSAVDATRIHWFFWIVLAAGAVNTVLSLFYYLNVLRVMIFMPARLATAETRPESWLEKSYLGLVTIPVVGLGVAVQSFVPFLQWVSRVWSS